MISAIKTFNKWCVRAGLTADQSVQRLIPPKIPDTLVEPHSERDALALCNVIRDEAMPTREQVLPWAIVELLYGCGLRISELTGLDLADIDTQSMSLKVRGGKGDKDRVLPIGPQQLLPILMWLLVRDADDDQPALLTGVRGGRLDARQTRREYQQACHVAGVPPLHPHALRHSCATHMVDHGADIRFVGEFLGHESLTSTQRYVHVAIQRLVDEVRKAHPREKVA